MPLPGFPVEICCSILELMSTEDLYSTITGSAEYFRVFNMHRRSILTKILLRDLHSDTLRHMLAVVRLPKVGVHNQATDDDAYRNLWNYFEAYREGTSPIFNEFPTDVDELVALAKLDILISRLTYRYYNGTMAVLHHQGGVPQIELQFTEDTRQTVEIPDTVAARIKRAFTRIELYIRCFPIPTGRVEFDECYLVFGLLRQWEREEIQSVYLYLKDKLYQMIMRMNRNVIIDVRSQEVTANTTIRKRKRGQENHILHSLCRFSGAELDGLLIYGQDRHIIVGGDLVEETSAPLIHLGLNYMERLFDAQGLQWMDLLRRDVGSLDPRYKVLHRFLEWTSWENPGDSYEHDEPFDEENIEGPGYGYEAYYNRHQRYWGYNGLGRGVVLAQPRRRLGFSFWDMKMVDYARDFAVLHEEFLNSLDGPANLRHIPLGRVSAEEALHGVEITRESLEAIRAKHGFFSECFRVSWKKRLRKGYFHRSEWNISSMVSSPTLNPANLHETFS